MANYHQEATPPVIDSDKMSIDAQEHVPPKEQPRGTIQDITYDNDEDVPEFHARTYMAVAALFLINLVQVFALTGPPAILQYIGADLNGTETQTWVPNALALIQAIGGPVISFASDTFQARKPILIAACTLAFIGAGIAPNSNTIYRVIGAQILIGWGFAAVPLAYAIPSEILPRRWRPVVQAGMNIAAAIGACIAPVIGGALTQRDAHTGWRNFYWIQMALWGVTAISILFGYHPTRRRTDLDHLPLMEKIGRLDLPGMGLLTTGLTLLLTGLSLGGNPWSWSNVRVVTTLVVGLASLISFGIYEWKGTKTGILHHELVGRSFTTFIALIFIEGIQLTTIIVFYPPFDSALFDSGALLNSVRTIPFWICTGISTVVYGVWSSRTRNIKFPLMTGFILFSAGLIGLATIRPGQSTRMVVFDGLAGLGFGAPLILIITGVQLSTPHHLIATATAVVTSTRAIASGTFTAIYGAIITNNLHSKLPEYVAKAALQGGLPMTSVQQFVGSLLTGDTAALSSIPGVTPTIIEASIIATKEAAADSFRNIFIIAIAFGAAAAILSLFTRDMSGFMTYRVEAPVEVLHAKNDKQGP